MCDLLMPTFCTSELEVSMLNLEKRRLHGLLAVLIGAGASGPSPFGRSLREYGSLKTRPQACDNLTTTILCAKNRFSNRLSLGADVCSPQQERRFWRWPTMSPLVLA